MNFNRLIKDSKEGLKRKISSRRERISVSVDEFNTLSKKYFDQIKEGENLTIKYDKKDEETLVFILRWYYNLWIDINENNIQELEEFEIAQFEDEGIYLRVLLPNQKFIKTYQNKGWNLEKKYNFSIINYLLNF